ncbi:hypothetical protein TIFTF001_055709 [Ficus carica]|uniref:Uncharacterized protein n=1 Tax=Ficus carica TaxID=3494 RepID=A0AA88JDY1_FICCA|nr:hypothetical protein TIFTF001_055709 [Ficus carica]
MAGSEDGPKKEAIMMKNSSLILNRSFTVSSFLKVLTRTETTLPSLEQSYDLL